VWKVDDGMEMDVGNGEELTDSTNLKKHRDIPAPRNNITFHVLDISFEVLFSVASS
jgi:hypothetical protein